MMNDDIKGDRPAGVKPPQNSSLILLTDDDPPLHDQLPSVEEARTSLAAENLDHPCCDRKSRLWLAWFGAMCITGLIVWLSVGLTQDGDGDYGGGNVSDRPHQPDDEDGVDYTVERFMDTTTFLQSFSTHIETFADPDSAQYRAAQWLAAEDSLRIPIPTSTSDPDAMKFVQRYGLAVLYYSLGGEVWEDHLQFLSDQDECKWYRFGWDQVKRQFFKVGASCDSNDEGFVKTIWIPNNNARGSIPREITLFNQLEYFSLEDNNITSTIPDTEWNALSKLWYLKLDRNSISGEIPASVGDLEKLQVLGLSNNNLNNTIPDAMSNLASLKLLSLDDNNLEGFFTPILNLKNLNYLYLEDNLFDGTLKGQMFNDLMKLVHLDLSGNFLEGTVPAKLFNFPNLNVIDVNDNNLDVLPDTISVQTNLEFLSIQNNLFKGQMPGYFENLKGLTHLDLSINLFSGSIPTMIGTSKLRYLFLGENNFGESPMPQFLQNLTNLEELSLKNSKMTGNIPTWIGKLAGLRLLDLDGNNLVGKIPDELESLVSLRALLLNQNNLNGRLPRNLTKLTDLALLLLDNNTLEGDINFMCESISTLTYVSSDCGGAIPEVNCTKGDCCDLCCDDAIRNCNNLLWRGNYDPRWENSYERTEYQFQLKLETSAGSAEWVPEDVAGESPEDVAGDLPDDVGE